ncbi:MAG: hypothetical protein LQ350_004224 [Teloschistes chrysophthalmus]|nr:MAG: hypothetical protein LQ350_004224 [Niorma chrysophthalma]
MTSNSAAWLVGEKVNPLEVKAAPYTSPGQDEIVVKNAALAVNTADHAGQAFAQFPYPYPFILGEDVAGEIVEVGTSITSFKKGDRVLGFAFGSVSHRKEEGAFQQYTVLRPQLTSIIPDSLPFERAAVLPLCLATAAAGLYDKDHLHLEHPFTTPKPMGRVVLIWGGASCVGSNAIQLALASGYAVFTTASSKNFEYVRKLGAAQVFDYTESTVTDDIIAALEGKTIAGVFDAVGRYGAFESCLDVVGHSSFTGRKFISTVRPPPEKILNGVEARFAYSGSIKDNDIYKAIFGTYIPQALAEGKFVAAPDPYMVGKGLEHVQAGLDLVSKGMSASKAVITL